MLSLWVSLQWFTCHPALEHRVCYPSHASYFFDMWVSLKCLHAQRVFLELFSWYACSAQRDGSDTSKMYTARWAVTRVKLMGHCVNWIKSQDNTDFVFREAHTHLIYNIEQRNPILGAVLSGSLSVVTFRCKKGWVGWEVSCKKTRWDTPNRFAKYKCWKWQLKVRAHCLWEGKSLKLIMQSSNNRK